MRARVLRCDIKPLQGSAQWTFAELLSVTWLSIFLVILLMVFGSTVINFIFNLRDDSPKSKTHSLVTSMSIYKSFNHFKNIQLDRINDSKPVFLYAIRTVLILWVFLVSLTSQLDFQYLRELLSLRSLIMQLPMQIIVNSSLQFDAIILLTAFTYSYQNINSNMKDLVKYNISKYSRLMPSIMLFVAITSITPLLFPSMSPVWHDFVDQPAQVCKSNGYLNLFFLQNLLNYDQICLPQTWIFCVELQLCLLAIPLVYLMNKNFDTHHGRFKLGSFPILSLIAIALGGCIINFKNIYSNQFPAAWFQTFPDKQDKALYFTQHLYKTWTHLTTFAVGLFTGHLCRCQSIATFSGRPYGRKCCATLMWLTGTTTMLLLIFCTHSWSLSGNSHLEAPFLSALYAALAPLLWSISWSLFLFHLTVPSSKTAGSSSQNMIARALNEVNVVRLGRLAFLAYLINPYVNYFVFAAQEQAIFSSIIMLGHTFIGNLVVTFVLAFLVSILVELPCRRLIKKLALGSRRHCTNLGIITRQLNIRQQNLGPSHDSFSASQVTVDQQQSKQQQQPMITMK